ncbi:DUF3152 domain-containing protein [Nocardioides carbamazepini]|uniref:DUF3152 domain-containing protein n=1 Tax=Nocardioides carbamazepini TaxID=2854259 RepID=UPI00214A7C5B|nr:DUF3152 domain-containing protein [Nocardioides carbamazepini]MCR1782143.1 DUF3152 domain-containing protein [Nocardioides carbamazepini]
MMVPRALIGLLLALSAALAFPAAPAAADDLPPLAQVQPPSYDGARKYGRTLKADPGTWAPAPERIGYQWLRDGVPISGEVSRRHEIVPEDVGHRLDLVVVVGATGYADTAVQVRVGRVKHRVGVRRTVRYSVRTRGAVGGVDVADFRRLAQETYDDPRGWRARGVRFRQVKHGGAFTLWLSQARLVPSFSGSCSATWSCRVGRNVIINVDRWRDASPAWNGAGRSLRDYRHMVVNHETGHWLGRGHASCPRRGALAPVMMQQSKGTQGCRFNPWPTPRELGR